MKYFCFIYFILIINNFGQSNGYDYKWEKYAKNEKKQVFQYSKNLINKDNEVISKYNSLPKNEITYVNNIKEKINSNEWERMDGPLGGNIRKFYEFGLNRYALSDRDVFLLNGNTWESLKLENLACAFIKSMYEIKPGELIVGSDGGLFYTKNNGANWNRISIGNNYWISINDILFTEDKKLLLSTSRGVFISSIDRLEFKSYALQDEYICTLKFDDLGNIWAGGRTSIYKANYSNLIWHKLDLELSFCSKFIFDADKYIYALTSNKILRSNDFGFSWMELTGQFSDITLDVDRNLIMLEYQKILKSDTNGVFWESVKFETTLLEIGFFENANCFLGSLGDGILKYDFLTNTFSNYNKGLNISTIWSIVTLPNNDLVIGTSSREFYKSIDNGINWSSTYKAWSRCIESSNDGVIYAAVDCGLVKSENNGDSWEKLNLDVSPYFINAIDIGEDNTTVCVGTSTGEVFVSYNSGESFKKIKEENHFFVDAIKIINEDTYLIKNGPLYFTNDYGENLTASKDTLIRSVHDFVIDEMNYIYLTGYDGIFKSVDGENWSVIQSSLSDVEFLKVDQYNNLYAVTDYGAVYCSNDKGDSWTKVSDGIPNTHIHCFGMTHEGYLFLGTQNKGLYRQRINISKKDFLKNNIAYNFPNPFNNQTRIEYTISKNSFVEIKIYNILGEVVETIVAEYKEKGEYYEIWNPTNIASGIYFYNIKVENEINVGKMVYLK